MRAVSILKIFEVISINKYQLSKNKNKTLDLLNNVDRPGIDALIYWLETFNFFESPASTKYHNNFEGGLNLHCLGVYDIFSKRNRKLENPVSKESEIICSICHDLCKVDYYYHNGEEWKSKKEHPMNRLHGVLSVDILQHFIELTKEEEAIIKYHMGLFSVYGYVKEYTAEELHDAISKYITVQVFASCDNEEAHKK